MKTLLIGNGYWGSIIKKKLEAQTDLMYVADSKDDIDYVLKTCELDFVFICTPTETHYNLVKKCIENKKNIFCEKPFTGDFDRANELFNMAEDAGIKLFVDNVFLYRNEFIGNTKKTFLNVEFIWNKYEEVFKEDLFNTLLYHDLYLLIEMCDISWKLKNCHVTDDNLLLILSSDGITSKFVYNRNCFGVKEKKIILDDYVIDFSYPKNDPLFEIISSIKKDNVDFKKNKEITMKTINLLNKIKNECILHTSRHIK